MIEGQAPSEADALDTTATDEATTDERAAWLTVAEAARRLKVSERAIQRRCKAGKLHARLIPTPTGQQWEINAEKLERAPTETTRADAQGADSTDRDDKAAATLTTEATQETTETTLKAATPTTGTTQGADRDDRSRDTLAAALMSEKDARIVDLRGQLEAARAQIEQHQRAEAELRATLREALKAMPKALPIGSDEAPAQMFIPTPSGQTATNPPRPSRSTFRSWLLAKLKG